MTSGVRRAGVVVGRERELERLLRAVHSARSGEATCLILVGEGGVGKTRLLGETASAARRLDTGVLTGRGPITTPVAFSLVAEALRSWLRGHAIEAVASPFDRGLHLVLPEWTGVAEPTELSGAQLRLLALEGIVRVVREITTVNRGAVVLLDDLHAADPESLEATRYLATAAVPGTTVVGALRPGESALADELVRSLRHAGVADLVEVGPLDERAVSDLVAALLDSHPPQALVSDIVARTDGVPLLVEEVLQAHLRAGSVEVGVAGASWRGGGIAVPRTIRDMVGDRLERLPRPHRDVLVAGAVLGDFEPSVMPAVAGVDVAMVHDALAAGIHTGLLETTGGAVGFRHAIIRDAVLEGAVPHAVDLMHRRAEAAFGALNTADARTDERRAHHLIALGDDDTAAQLLTTAAVIRVAEHAPLGAERLARTSHGLARTPATRSAAADAIASSLAAQGRWMEALDADATAVADHGDSPARRHRMATSALEAGRADLASTIIARALEAGDNSPLIHIAAGRAALVVGEAEHALEYAVRVLDRATADDDLDARLGALDLQGRAFDYLGRRAEAEAAWTQQAAEARAAGRTQAQLRAVVQLGKVELFAGRRPVRLYEAVDVARSAGALVELGWAEENLAICLALHGHTAAARAVIAEAIPRCREHRLDQLAYLLATHAVLESYTTESVEPVLAEAEALAPASDVLLATTSIRGDIALRRGRYDDAVHWFGVTAEMARAMPGVVPVDGMCWLAWALAASGRYQEAAGALEDARAMPDLARWYGRPVIVAAAAAMLAQDEQGIDDAIAGAPGPMPLDIALMRTLGAEIIRGPARVRWLREALDIYEAVAMPLGADRVRSLLREAGGPVPRRRAPSAAVPESLADRGVTAREAEVLQLLGDGLSNADIAQRLFLSVRTVETHVSSMLGKLDLRSRGQLTALSLSIRHQG